MEKKRTELSPFLLIVGVGVLLFLAVAGYFLITFLNSSKASKPEIVLIQPTIPQTIENTQGFLFVVQATDEKGIQRIEFLENGLPKGRAYPPNVGMTELLSQIAWMPDGIGIYELSFIAYDLENTASDPAAITIGVISPGLSQADVDEIETEVAASIPSNTAPEDVSSNGVGAGEEAGNQDALQEDDGNAGGDEGNAPDDEMEFVQVQGGAQDIRPLNSDQPPEITDFETGIQREGDGIRVNVHVMAQDDVGVSTIIVVDNMENNNQEIPIQIEHDCLDETSCALTTSEVLGPGNHSLIIIAMDTLGQLSRPYYKDIEILPNLDVNEGPAVIEEADGLLVPAGLLNGIHLQGGGLFGIAPFVNLGWIHVEEPGDFELIDNCPPNCPPTSIKDMRLEVEQWWDTDSLPMARLSCFYPQNMQSTAENPTVCVQAPDMHLNCNFSDWRMLCRVPMNFMRENGPFYTEEILALSHPYFNRTREMCGAESETLTPVLVQDNVVVEEGTPFTFTPLPCPPLPPNLVSITATEDCLGSDATDDYCIYVHYNMPIDLYIWDYLEIDHFVLVEKLFDGFHLYEREFILSPEQGVYTNTDVLRNRVYEYQMFSVSSDGIRSEIERLNIRVPRPIDDPYAYSINWQEHR